MSEKLSTAELVAITLALEEDETSRPKATKRKYAAHPINEERRIKGQFNNSYQELRKYPEKFFSFYRMSTQSFDEMLSLIKPNIFKMENMKNDTISPEERLTITLKYLATGATFNQLHLDFFVGKSTIRVIIKETLSVLWEKLQPLEMPEPTKETWLKTAEGFYKTANFPNCLGAVDGKHIRIINPAKSGSDYYNYKHFFSVVLMALVDSNYCFLSIDVGAYGREGDPNIFKKSPLGKKLYDCKLDIPCAKKLPNDNGGKEQPFVIVGDEAFALHENLLRPYPRKNLDIRKKVFNFRLTRARRYVECAFGILANKWRVFHTPILVEPDFATLIIKAACVLHNFVRRRDGVEYEDTFNCTLDSIDQTLGGSSTNNAREVRDYFATYFDSPEGKLDWQYNAIA